jgi:hypothetical protein
VNGIPVVRLEIEGMKHTIMHAMTQHLAHMDSDIRAAVERACKPEHISELIETTARKQIAEAVKAEIESFYRYGPGRKAVKEAVIKTLGKDIEE